MGRTPLGAQTVRRGGAGPVGGLLGGKDPTGRFTSTAHQFVPSTSPPEGVTAAHHVPPLTFGDRVRTLPSARPTTIPPGWAVAVRVGSQLPRNGVGWYWNFEPGPTASRAPRGTRPAIANPGWKPRGGRSIGGGCQGKGRAVQYAHAVTPSRNAGAMVVFEQRAYFSAWRMVFDSQSVMSS